MSETAVGTAGGGAMTATAGASVGGAYDGGAYDGGAYDGGGAYDADGYGLADGFDDGYGWDDGSDGYGDDYGAALYGQDGWGGLSDEAEAFYAAAGLEGAGPAPQPQLAPDGDGPGGLEPVAVLGHLSDLLAAGQRLHRSDTAPLQELVGRRAARALTGRLEQDWSQARRQRSWWHRLGRLLPLPGSLAELVARWQDGEQLHRADQDLLTEIVGKDLARRLLPDVRRGWWR